MADWMEQYTAALDVRDAHEGASSAYIDAYTKLADRTARLESDHLATDPEPPPPSDAISTPKSKPTQKTKQDSRPSSPSTATIDQLTRLRADLSATQSVRSALQIQMTALTSQIATQATSQSASASRISALERSNRELERRLRDRDSELKGKARLVEEVQDEMVGLNLQLNMAEEKAERVKRENEELVRRWMERMGEEAERMNVESRWS